MPRARARKLLLASAAIAALAAIGSMRATAQPQPEAPPSFDVASIKPLVFEPVAVPGRNGMMGPLRIPIGALSLSFTPGRVFSGPAGVPAWVIVRDAYNVAPYQLSQGPDWIYTDRFHLEAKAEGANERQLRQMLQSLLAERFQLALHRGSKQMPVYALKIAKKGTKLREWQAGDPMPGFSSKGHQHSFIERGKIDRLIDALFPSAGRPIVDRTGLSGVYVFHVEWDDGPNFLSAALSQLGLRLESQKGPVDFFTIERIEQPSEN
jgi:uncharacterized protein (TIGR03435 family)